MSLALVDIWQLPEKLLASISSMHMLVRLLAVRQTHARLSAACIAYMRSVTVSNGLHDMAWVWAELLGHVSMPQLSSAICGAPEY